MGDKMTVVRIDPKLHLELKLEAVRRGEAMTNIVNQLVRDWLDKAQRKEGAS